MRNLSPKVTAILVTILATARVHAALITLSATDPSSVDASVYSTIEADYNTTFNPVATLPYTTPSTADGATGDFSTVTPAVTTTDFSFTYSENLANSADYYADADGDILFVAGPNVQYTIAAVETVSNPDNTLIVDLNDENTLNSVYNFQQSDSDSLNVTSGSQPLTGQLTAGVTYEFYADEDMHNGPGPDPTLSGSASIIFTTVPEPASAALLVATLAAAARRPRQRRPRARALATPPHQGASRRLPIAATLKHPSPAN